MRCLLFIIICFTTTALAQQLKIKNFKAGDDGTISWSVLNEKVRTSYRLEDFRWNRWVRIVDLGAKGIGDHTYTYQADTSCGLYKVRIAATDYETHFSDTITYAHPKKVTVISPLHLNPGHNTVLLSSNSKYEVYDQYGNLVLHGCNSQINTAKLPKGLYFLLIGNDTLEFIKQ